MDYLPIFIDLRDRRCLLVGGGEVATRKTDLLLQAGAAVQAVAPVLGPGMQALVDDAERANLIGDVPALLLIGVALALLTPRAKDLPATSPQV